MSATSQKFRSLVLKEVYEKPDRHQQWESVYRDDPLLNEANDVIMDGLLREMNLPPDGVVLDAGCGVGDHTIRIARHGFHCVGTDISQFILDQADRRVKKVTAALGVKLAPITFSCQSLENLTFPDKTFDAVHCRGVLMHIPDWERALKNLCRVLKPGGSIVIMEQNAASPTALAISGLRLLTKSKQVKVTRAGVEYWKHTKGEDFLIRTASMKYLENRLTQLGIEDLRRFCTSLVSVGTLPSTGKIRNMAIRLNRQCFTFGIPPGIGHGNAIVGRKSDLNKVPKLVS